MSINIKNYSSNTSNYGNFNMNLSKKLSEKEWHYNTPISSPFKITPFNPSKNIQILIYNTGLPNYIVVIPRLKYSNYNSNLPFFMSMHSLNLIVKREDQFKNNKSAESWKVLLNVSFFLKVTILIMVISNLQQYSSTLKQDKLSWLTLFSLIMANQLIK